MEEDERYVSFEKVQKEAEQLRGMGKDDAIEVVKSYHQMYLKAVHECVEQIQKISNLSPLTLPITDTAIIVAERDFIDKRKNNRGQIAICGSNGDVIDLINQLWNVTPECFEQVAKSHGFVKAEEKSA